MRQRRSSVAFFDRTYNDAVDLLQESRTYFREHATQELSTLDPTTSMYLSEEASRVTKRMTEVMTWLLAQKAAHYEQIPRDLLSANTFRLSHDPGLSEDSADACEVPLPKRLRDLLNKTHSLYRRVQYLDGQVYGKASVDERFH
ncbi:MAG: DUF1465 family protein [Alphaproteobacteria bacterium]